MKNKKVINDIKEWFKKNKSSLEDEPLTYWLDGYIIKGCDISKELKSYSLMVHVDDFPTLADNRWEIGCDIYLGNYEFYNKIVDGYSKNGLSDAIIEAVKKLDLD